MRRVIKDNALSLVMLALFVISLGGQILTGHREYNQDQVEHKEAAVSLGTYLSTGHFVEAVFENWESEFLQMGMYVLLTAVLIQKGSSESKKGDGSDPQDEDPNERRFDPSVPFPVRRGGILLSVYQHSL